MNPIPCKAQRVVSTGIGFAFFMLTGIVMSLTVFPLILVMPFSYTSKQKKMLDLLRFLWLFFIYILTSLRIFALIRVTGLENIQPDKPYLLIANHPTLLDVVVIGSRVRNLICIIKPNLMRHPFFALLLREIGYISASDPEKLIEKCIKCFMENRSLLVFPEGTRTKKDRGIGYFKRGAAQIALRTGVETIPVVIKVDPPTLKKSSPWYKVPPKAPTMTLRVGEPLKIPEEIVSQDSLAKQSRMLTKYFENYFLKELQG